MSLEQFSALAERDGSIDRDLDARMARDAAERDVVLEGRLTAWVCREFHLPAFKVRLDAPERVRAERIAKREAITLERALEDNRRREASERARYQRYYGVDMSDPTLYDHVVDTTQLGAAEVAGAIAEGARRHGR